MSLAPAVIRVDIRRMVILDIFGGIILYVVLFSVAGVVLGYLLLPFTNAIERRKKEKADQEAKELADYEELKARHFAGRSDLS